MAHKCVQTFVIKLAFEALAALDREGMISAAFEKKARVRTHQFMYS